MSKLTKLLDKMKSDLKRKESEVKVLKEQIAEMEKVIEAKPAAAKPAGKPASKAKAKTTKPARKSVKKS